MRGVVVRVLFRRRIAGGWRPRHLRYAERLNHEISASPHIVAIVAGRIFNWPMKTKRKRYGIA